MLDNAGVELTCWRGGRPDKAEFHENHLRTKRAERPEKVGKLVV